MSCVIGLTGSAFIKTFRGAGQAFAEMYVALGKAMELDLDKVVALLLLKAADTNKFIR